MLGLQRDDTAGATPGLLIGATDRGERTGGCATIAR